eukprot:6284532-Pyramimonas_sp.AAC.1
MSFASKSLWVDEQTRLGGPATAQPANKACTARRRPSTPRNGGPWERERQAHAAHVWLLKGHTQATTGAIWQQTHTHTFS